MVTVRTAEPTDALEVARVHVRSWQQGYRGLLPDEYLEGLRPEDRAARYTLGRPVGDGPETVVALEGHTIRGFATIGGCEDASERGGELLALYVDPGHWGRGIGQRLMTESRHRLMLKGFCEAILWVLVGNERAQRFYRADGWIPDGGRRQHELWGVTVEESRYRRARL